MRQRRLMMAVQDLGFIRVAEKFLHELSAPITVWSMVMLFTKGEKGNLILILTF